MDRLSPLDAAFLEVEDADPHASLAIASMAVLEGPAPARDEFTAAIGARFRTIRRSRQKVRRVPLDLGLPVWVDDPDFDLDYHLRRTALPHPGDDRALTDLVARIMAQRLDRDRPLWECWVVEGLADGRWAMLTKVHHCLVDGVAGTRLYSAVFDDSTSCDVDDVAFEAAPGTVRLLADAIGDLVLNPVEQLRLLGRLPGLLAGRLTDTVRGLTALAGAVVPARASSLSGPIGVPRRYRVARLALTDVIEVGRAFGVTVNDVVLAAISAGLRAVLLHRGETPEPDSVRTMVPVSVRADGHRDSIDNRVSVILPFLPVDLADPVEVLREVHRRMTALKAEKESEAGAAMTSLAEHEPHAPLSWGIRLVGRLPQRNVVTVTTNVPGPTEPVRVLGRRILEILPYVPIALRLRTGVAVLSYAGTLAVGVTADYDSTPDVDLVVDTVQRTIGALTAEAAG
ncbi:wax ester/triacylglycerol synthase family O-acyltransferase [Umezawaea endophytica]|uniref:Diacylglycerol O-acyltransferase n=1 Tax=Umezawaea endophytica TaxID=1654476 RepID=A0A9X2VYY3_9PSEU|nr:wax ester/triacylglycerol synthase family O-acyltransferase [Umezawaea endophytica]MCS7484732.1 wax ester/triacylglycerol synthase family O-acyltransferase [Umezawaea endophytica]